LPHKSLSAIFRSPDSRTKRDPETDSLPRNRESGLNKNILEKFFGNTHIVHPQNIGVNGRIVIDKGRNEIFFLRCLHYNDTCKVNRLSHKGIDFALAVWDSHSKHIKADNFLKKT
jgi:hypothetical protein